MTKDRETPSSPDPSGTSNLSVITGGKDKAPTGNSKAKGKGKTYKRSAPNITTGLTDKQETFVQGIIDGLSQREAYRAAYDATGMSDTSVDVEAWKLIRNPKVTQRLISLQHEIEQHRRAISISRYDRTLNLIENFMFDEGLHPSIRTRNAELMGKHLGLFVDRVETTDKTEQSADEIEARLKAKLGIA